jgi:hypothetical protein
MNSAPISIRPAHHDDYVALWRVATLDGVRLPSDPLVVAEADGEIVAALSLASGEAVANPFRRTAEAVALLRLRVSQLSRDRSRPRGLLRRLRGRPAPVVATQ